MCVNSVCIRYPRIFIPTQFESKRQRAVAWQLAHGTHSKRKWVRVCICYLDILLPSPSWLQLLHSQSPVNADVRRCHRTSFFCVFFFVIARRRRLGVHTRKRLTHRLDYFFCCFRTVILIFRNKKLEVHRMHHRVKIRSMVYRSHKKSRQADNS